MIEQIANLEQSWPAPSRPRPIVIIGSGGIVNDAHLPAYRKAGFPVAGVFDIDPSRSRATAEKFSISRVFASLEEAFGTPDAVFDLAVPPENVYGVLQAIPPRTAVLIQKPLGIDLADARRIRQLCREKGLTAAVNFQLRFSPMMLAIRDALRRGLIGRILDLEVRLHTRTPWELFPFLTKLQRVEIQVHSIHYLDWIRSVLGEPRGAYARTVRHPDFPELKSVRTSAILDYGDDVRCCLTIQHCYPFGPRHQAATVQLEGTLGAATATLGLLLNYPTGEPDVLEIATLDTRLRAEPAPPLAGSPGDSRESRATTEQDWCPVPLQGRWFPDGFVGRMANMQRFIAGEDEELVASVEDAYRTMALVEACYESDAHGATPIPE